MGGSADRLFRMTRTLAFRCSIHLHSAIGTNGMIPLSAPLTPHSFSIIHSKEIGAAWIDVKQCLSLIHI